MIPTENLIGQPIYSLQLMLRTIQTNDGNELSVVPDGIYGEDTAASVRRFQKNYNLPVTGETDLATWERIVEVFEIATINRAPAAPLQIILNPDQIIKPGDNNLNLYIIQGMLLALSSIYPSIPKVGATGVHDSATVAAILWLQKIYGLPQTGSIDKVTWLSLVKFYGAAIGNGE